jgi:hypothetical protein
MDALPIDVQPSESAKIPPPDSRPRSGEGLLAEEAIYGRASHASRQPEAALMCAVLQDAVESFQNQFISATWHAKRLGEEAERWFFSDDADWVFSFLSVCAALDLCPQYIRQGIKRWRTGVRQPARQHRAEVLRMTARGGR